MRWSFHRGEFRINAEAQRWEGAKEGLLNHQGVKSLNFRLQTAIPTSKILCLKQSDTAADMEPNVGLASRTPPRSAPDGAEQNTGWVF